MGKVISTAIRFIDGFTRPSKSVLDSMKKMGNEAVKAGRKIQNAGKTISNTGSSLTKAITLPVAGVATAAVKTAADFEAAISEVGAISKASAKDMEKLEARAKEMGAATSFSASESAEAMKYMAMAGWKTADMTNGIKGIMDLAAASGESLAATSDIVTDGLTAFGMSAKESGRFADVMATASTSANTNVALMGETFKYCASTAGAMGYSIEDVSVAIGIMGNAGIKGSMAGTAIKNTISNLAKPTASQAEMMKKLGISLTDSNGKMKSFAEVMNNLRSSFSGLSKKEKAAAASTLAGKQSMSGLLTIVNAGTKDFDELTKAINGSKGSAGEMANKMLDNLKGQLTLLKSAVEGIAITIGNKLMPYVKTAVSWVQKAADYINKLSDAQMDNMLKWAGFAAAIGPAIMVFGKIVTTIGKVHRTFGIAMKTIGNFGGIVGLITSPAGIVIGVLGAIAIAAVLIIKNWKQVKDFLKDIGGWFKNVFEDAGYPIEGFTDKFISIRKTFGKVTDKIKDLCKVISKVFKKEFAGSIKESTTEAGGTLETFVGGTAAILDGIVTAVDKGLKAFDVLLGFFTGAFAGDWEGAAQGFRKSLKNIFPPDMADGMIKVFDIVLPGIKDMFTGFVKDVKKILGGVTKTFEGIGTMLKGIFKGDAETALKGFQTAAGGIIDTVGNIFKTRINAIKNFVVGTFSSLLPESAIDQIAGAFDIALGAWDVAIGAAKGYVSGFVRAVKPLVENIKTVFEGVGQFVKGVFTKDWKGALDGLKNISSGAFDGLVNVIKAPFVLVGDTVKGAVDSFKKLNIVKKIFKGLGDAITKMLSNCGIDMKKFGDKINNIKTRVGNIIEGIKTIFRTAFSAAGDSIEEFKINAGIAFAFISDGIKAAMDVIVPVVKVAFGAVKGAISAAIDTITSIVSGMLTALDGVITFIAGVFTGNWKKAWEGVKTIFKGIFETFAAICKAPINAVIGVINGAISGINEINVTIPDWAPKGLAGKKLGFDLPTIPMLYKGTDNWKGGVAVIHDRGGEIVDLPKGSRVYPHDKSVEMARRDGERDGAGSITVIIQKLADKIEVRSDEDIDRIAAALAYKLKQVALNTGTA